MRTTSRVAALTLSLSVGLATLTACSDDDPPAADPSPTWSPTGTMESPTASSAAAPVEPELPVEATEASEAGARAFIAYYWELINYAQVTGDVKALRAASGPNCDRCAAGVSAIKEVYRSGGHITDGRYTPTLTSVTQLKAQSHQLYAFEAKGLITNVAHAAVGANGQRQEFEASSTTYVVDVFWIDDHWRLDLMEVV